MSMTAQCAGYYDPRICTEYMVRGICDCRACLQDHGALRGDLIVRGAVNIGEDKAEAVDHPAHYNLGKIEAIDVIEDWGLGFCLGNVVKYICRAGYKGDMLEDLKKAEWYLRRALRECGDENEDMTERMEDDGR